MSFYYMKGLRHRDINSSKASRLRHLSFVATITVTNHFNIQRLQMTVPYVAGTSVGWGSFLDLLWALMSLTPSCKRVVFAQQASHHLWTRGYSGHVFLIVTAEVREHKPVVQTSLRL